MINPKIAEALDMEVPEEEETNTALVVVEPHEVVTVDNPELPDMRDIDIRQLEGEKQLEDVIRSLLGYVEELREDYKTIDPKFRNRHIENTNTALSIVIDALKHKTDFQLKKKDMRMKEKGFKPNKAGGDTTNNLFVGDRETLLKMIRGSGSDDS